jgi:hypothetical protein
MAGRLTLAGDVVTQKHMLVIRVARLRPSVKGYRRVYCGKPAGQSLKPGFGSSAAVWPTEISR